MAGAAIAATALLAAAGTASAGTTAAKAPTALSIAAAPGTSAKSGVKITGDLKVSKTGKALAHQWVWLAWVGGKGVAHRERALLTGGLGKVSFVVKPAKTTTYELLYLGTGVLAPTHSDTVTVLVAG